MNQLQDCVRTCSAESFLPICLLLSTGTHLQSFQDNENQTWLPGNCNSPLWCAGLLGVLGREGTYMYIFCTCNIHFLHWCALYSSWGRLLVLTCRFLREFIKCFFLQQARLCHFLEDLCPWLILLWLHHCDWSVMYKSKIGGRNLQFVLSGKT